MSSSITFVPDNIQDAININYAICGVLGLILNSAVLTVLVDKLKNKRTHTDIKICTFVASADILASLGLIFRSIIVKFPYNLLKANPVWCKLDVFIAQDINCSGYTLAIYGLAYVSITGRKRSMEVEVITQFTILYTVIVNALILLYMNQEVRISFIGLLRRIKNRIIPNRY
ncbi:hypothetical protein CONCODRAFT_13040 [Conidiobolus coronatus NRRL 28638]|uniref:G-protein coupled receptors family 1 profile domain-containing protein n=1 Tax=Conidiobolus coronatus (strain ATCC 28846 / CBS 209.66 / NRRL 28638) TaxID=796925 RepID=A0A137NRL8_CONC2|nr:hypothetical protein CONCODRAFT_13040 [Conidiobolus coronatus NRRL 28638]|eukprot:KXN65377.1 hypothetical protein CONCODRAFT_13040 [Conidiobolus coronatus NRRL 28638]